MSLSVSSAASRPASRFMTPTSDQLTRIYGQIARKRISDGTAKKLSDAPKGWEKAEKYTIASTRDRSVEVANIGGKLYARSTPVNPNVRASSWYALGRAPIF